MDVVVKGWKGLLVSSLASYLQVNMLPKALTSLVLSVFKMRLHSLSGQPVPQFSHSHGKFSFLHIKLKFPIFQLMPIVSHISALYL